MIKLIPNLSTINDDVPFDLVPNLKSGLEFSCLSSSSGTLKCWGNNERQQLNIPFTSNINHQSDQNINKNDKNNNKNDKHINKQSENKYSSSQQPKTLI